VHAPGLPETKSNKRSRWYHVSTSRWLYCVELWSSSETGVTYVDRTWALSPQASSRMPYEWVVLSSLRWAQPNRSGAKRTLPDARAPHIATESTAQHQNQNRNRVSIAGNCFCSRLLKCRVLQRSTMYRSRIRNAAVAVVRNVRGIGMCCGKERRAMPL
jgi:hypothetical protein